MESFNSQAAYQAYCDNITNILEVKLDPYSLARELFSREIIGFADKERITDTCSDQTAQERMGDLLDIVKVTVKDDETVFGQFIEILKEDDCSQREKNLAKKLMASYKGNDK